MELCNLRSSKICIALLSMLSVLTKAEDLVSLKALCSSNRAGVKWTAISPTYNGYIDLDFSCTNSNGNIIHVEGQDKCFHKINELPALKHMLYRSMTHTISMDLETGTVCIFMACIKSRLEEYMDTINDTCTIGAPTALPVLPVTCNRTGSEQCQCSCSPGFEGIADNSIDGNTCEAIAVPHLAPTVSSGFIIAPTSYIVARSKHQVTTSPITTSLTTITSSITAQTSPSITIPPTPRTSPPTPRTSSPIATKAVSHHSSRPGNSNTLTVIPVASGVAAGLLIVVIGTVILCLGTVTYKRMKLNRCHEQRTMPFKEQKREKIDPDFIPDNWKMDTRIVMSESTNSMLHTYRQHPQSITEEDGSALMMAVTGDEDGQVSDAKKQGAYVYRVSEGSSGYVTEGSLGFMSDSLIHQVNKYMEDNDEVRLQRESHVQNEGGFIVDRKISQRTSCSKSPEIYVDSISQDNDEVRLQGKSDVKNDSGYIVDRNNTRQTDCSPEEYLAPILCTDVSFTFPLENS